MDYKDNLISLNDHRLEFFQTGYGLPALIESVFAFPLEVSVDYRSILSRLVATLSKFPPKRANFYISDPIFLLFPEILLGMGVIDRSCRVFSKKLDFAIRKQNWINSMMAKEIEFILVDSLSDQVRAPEKELGDIFLLNYEDFRDLEPFLCSYIEEERKRVIYSVVRQYFHAGNESRHFNLKKNLIGVTEYADHSAELYYINPYYKGLF